jgi:SAM-dependent methyltransferase
MIIRDWIKNKLSEIPTGFRILDAGAGQCQYKQYCSHLVYESQDSCDYDGKDEGKWDFSQIDIKSDITDIQRGNGFYDAILCTDVFEHIVEPFVAICEFKRLLKPKGKLILSNPFCCLVHQQPYFFNSGMHINWYEKVFEGKFKILEWRTDGNWFTQIRQELERLKTNQICKYFPFELNALDINNIDKVIDVLSKCNANGNGSQEILCGSYQVLAEKI